MNELKISEKMKTLRTLVIVIICTMFLFSAVSCVVLVKKDNGKHKGWSKNTNSPNSSNSEKSKRKK